MPKTPKNSPLFEKMFGKQSRKGRIISYDLVDPILLGRLVIAVNDAGCSVLVGATRDRGAWSLTFYGDSVPDGRQTDYQNDEDSVSDWIEKWVEDWEATAEALKDSKPL